MTYRNYKSTGKPCHRSYKPAKSDELLPGLAIQRNQKFTRRIYPTGLPEHITRTSDNKPNTGRDTDGGGRDFQ